MQIALWVTCEATPQKTFRGRASPSDIPTFKASRFQSFPAVEKIRRCEAAGSSNMEPGRMYRILQIQMIQWRPSAYLQPTFYPSGHQAAFYQTDTALRSKWPRQDSWSGTAVGTNRPDRRSVPRICTRHREGGAMQRLRFVDFKRGRKDDSWLKASWKQVESLKWHEVTRSGHLSTAGIIVL